MKINYKGRYEDKSKREHRLAEITFAESEERDYKRLAQVMSIKGWDLQLIINEYAACEVEDREEYEMFLKDYKEVKKSISLWKKFGI